MQSSPFGIAFYSDITFYEVIEDVGQGKFFIKPPKPHPSFVDYVVQYTPTLGIVWIKANGAIIHSDDFGYTTKASVDTISKQLESRYGLRDFNDFIIQGSIWNEAQYWMQALSDGHRFYHYL